MWEKRLEYIDRHSFLIICTVSLLFGLIVVGTEKNDDTARALDFEMTIRQGKIEVLLVSDVMKKRSDKDLILMLKHYEEKFSKCPRITVESDTNCVYIIIIGVENEHVVQNLTNVIASNVLHANEKISDTTYEQKGANSWTIVVKRETL